MRHLLLLFISTLSINVSAQTKIIAHKSHSGTSATFDIFDNEDNFGLSPEMFTIKTYQKLNDSTVITYTTNTSSNESYLYDTIRKKEVLNTFHHGSDSDLRILFKRPIFLDSLRWELGYSKFIGFDDEYSHYIKISSNTIIHHIKKIPEKDYSLKNQTLRTDTIHKPHYLFDIPLDSLKKKDSYRSVFEGFESVKINKGVFFGFDIVHPIRFFLIVLIGLLVFTWNRNKDFSKNDF